MSASPAVELRDVFCLHALRGSGAVALQGLTLEVLQGERCVVLGPSGSGKSTMLRIAAGLERPSAGIARTLGIDLGALSLRRAAAFRARHLGFLDQHYARALSPALYGRWLMKSGRGGWFKGENKQTGGMPFGRSFG